MRKLTIAATVAVSAALLSGCTTTGTTAGATTTTPASSSPGEIIGGASDNTARAPRTNDNQRFCTIMRSSVSVMMDRQDKSADAFSQAGYYAGLAIGIGNMVSDYNLTGAVRTAAVRAGNAGQSVVDAANAQSMSGVSNGMRSVTSAIGNLSARCTAIGA